MDKKEVLEFITDQYLIVDPYRELIGEGIHPIIDCLIEVWEKLCILAGFAENEAEYIVSAIMHLDYIKVAKFCKDHNIDI